MTKTTSPKSTEDGEPGGLVPMRLQKFLARAGVASRRGSEDLMTAGRVTVNGRVTTELGAKVDPTCDEVAVDGAQVRLGSSAAYFALNKPAGVVTTMDDPQGRRTVVAFLPKGHPRLFPVGRLDRDTTGLLLLTSDGELAHRLLHPKHHVPKTYRAVVDGEPSGADVRALADGIELDDGLTAPAEVRLIWTRGSSSEIELVIREGRKRQVRRMLSAVGHPVRELQRVSFGPIALGGLAEGETRALTDDEVAALVRAGDDAE